MLKFALLSLVMVSGTVMADVFPGVTGVQEISGNVPGRFEFRITEDQEGGGQAAHYVRPNLAELYLRALNSNSLIKRKVEKVYDDNECQPNGNYKDKDLEDMYCGDVKALDDSNTVLWSYGRAGWMGAGATYKTYLTFTSAGSGAFTSAVLEIETVVSVEAVFEPGDGQPAVFSVTVDMTSVKEIPQ